MSGEKGEEIGWGKGDKGGKEKGKGKGIGVWEDEEGKGRGDRR